MFVNWQHPKCLVLVFIVITVCVDFHKNILGIQYSTFSGFYAKIHANKIHFCRIIEQRESDVSYFSRLVTVQPTKINFKL